MTLVDDHVCMSPLKEIELEMRPRTAPGSACSSPAISDRWGIDNYARLNGVFSGPLMAAAAIAPFLGAGLALLPGGFPFAFGVLAAIGALGTVIAAAESPKH